MKRYLCYILLQILCICLLPIKGQSNNAEVVECNKTNTPSYTSSFTYQAFSPINIQAPTVNGTLGGSYANDYLYDKQYRLIQSDGNGGFAYSLKASYSPAGRMGSKSMTANNLVGNLRFGYDRKYFTHQPRTIYDPTEGTMECYWDANGNLSQIIGCKSNKARLHDWDEENRLRFVLGEKYAGYYGYDAKGERVYKLTGTSGIEQVNAGYSYSNAVFDWCVMYPNPYIVITPKGYTKHYYAGAERIATVLGGGGFEDRKYPVVSLDKQHDNDIINAFNLNYKNYDPFNHEKRLSDPLPTATTYGNTLPELDYQCNSIVLEHLDILSKQDILLGILKKNSEENFAEKDVYYYHGDHLGSASWITETNGKPIQYIHYAPYGEFIDNQRTIDYDERYKFTGKERDSESGYDYFGARYYASPFSFWLSVDPLADKYPAISPYAYCTWNPIKFIDPDGKEKHCFHTDSYYACLNLKDDSGIYFTTHGNIKGKLFGNSKKEITTQKKYLSIKQNNPKSSFEISLEKKISSSKQWIEDKKNNKTSFVFIFACHSGEKNASAQRLSNEEDFKNTIFIGAIGKLYSTHKYGKPSTEHYIKSEYGWGVYKNGKLLFSLPGWIIPNKTIINIMMWLKNIKNNENKNK